MEPFDCEALRAAVPRQPINTASSLVLLVAAGILWRRGHRVAALAVGAAGVGSVLFHGAPSVASSWVHDIGLAATLVVATAQVWRRLVDRRPPWASSAVFAVGIVVWALSRTGGLLCATGSVVQGHAVWHVLAGVSFVMLFGSRAPVREPVRRAQAAES